MSIRKSFFCRSYRIFLERNYFCKKTIVVNRITDSLELMKRKRHNSVFIIMDKDNVDTDAFENLKRCLKKTKLKYYIFNNIKDFSKTVEKAKKLYKDNSCSCLIGFGSSLALDYAYKFSGFIKNKDYFITVPVTFELNNNLYRTCEDVVVLKGKLTKNISKSDMSINIINVLDLALELYLDKSISRKKKYKLSNIIKDILDNIELACKNNNNFEAREIILKRSFELKNMLNEKYNGYCFTISDILSKKYNLKQELISSIIFPVLLSVYGNKAYKKIKKLSVFCNLVNDDCPREDAVLIFIERLKEINKRFNIPNYIKSLKEEDFYSIYVEFKNNINYLYNAPFLLKQFDVEKMLYSLTLDCDNSISRTVDIQREFFNSGGTLSIKNRKTLLKNLKNVIKRRRIEIVDALEKDLGKSEFESYMCEVGLTLSEISYMLKHLKKFTKDRIVKTPKSQFCSKSFVRACPYGVVLIMSPWNYPFLLSLEPLVDAIAAGNTVILKPSNYSKNTSLIIKEIIEEVFDRKYVSVVMGGREENSALLEEKFDYIFFTGSKTVGTFVLEKAAKNITPVTLELGGKSPCIVDKSANLKLAARRIVFGKFLNCGQTCVAPDYILCEESVKKDFLKYVFKEIERQFGKKPLNNHNYGKIINKKHYDRLIGLIDKDKVVYGGKTKDKELRIEPTVMDNVIYDDLVMQEEIFGPILPVLTFKNIDDVIADLKTKDKPLALYIFSKNKRVINKVTTRLLYGGGCVNDVIIHLATSNMGFGGVGSSGMGSYHGKDGFDTFTHYKSIVDKKNWIDLPMRYQPYKELNRLLIKLFLR